MPQIIFFHSKNLASFVLIFRQNLLEDLRIVLAIVWPNPIHRHYFLLLGVPVVLIVSDVASIIAIETCDKQSFMLVFCNFTKTIGYKNFSGEVTRSSQHNKVTDF